MRRAAHAKSHRIQDSAATHDPCLRPILTYPSPEFCSLQRHILARLTRCNLVLTEFTCWRIHFEQLVRISKRYCIQYLSSTVSSWGITLQISEKSPYLLHPLHCIMATNLLALLSSLASCILALQSQSCLLDMIRFLAPVPAPNSCTPHHRQPHHWWMSIKAIPEDRSKGRSSGQGSAGRRQEALACVCSQFAYRVHFVALG